jgi:hypothetical protein
MTLFTDAHSTQAYAKIGVLGFAGSGKTYTSALMAIGLVKLMKKLGLPDGEKPAYFLDTETGSDWVIPLFKKNGIPLRSAKTRAFKDLLGAVREAEKNGSVLIVDSITHFWRELCDAFAKKRRVERLEFQHWAALKREWGEFTDLLVNSRLHIIMCGRAGYEYDFFEDSDGKRQLEKTGIKMKAETETGFEPSLLILMERAMDVSSNEVWRVASVLKDRSTMLDGKSFRNPTFKDFLPHFKQINFGGEQLGVDIDRTSDELFDEESGDTKWTRERRQRDICLDEIAEIIHKHHPGTSGEAKSSRGALMEKHAQTRSWEAIKAMRLPQLQVLRNEIWKELEGKEYARPVVVAPDDLPPEKTEEEVTA